MKVHEYQAKEILGRYAVPVPKGRVAFSVPEAEAAAHDLGGSTWVVKAQIHAGGRGKGGGVRVARSLDEVRVHAAAILGMRLVTHQTGPQGQKVQRLLIEETAAIDRELYLGIVLDRVTGKLELARGCNIGLCPGSDSRRLSLFYRMIKHTCRRICKDVFFFDVFHMRQRKVIMEKADGLQKIRAHGMGSVRNKFRRLGDRRNMG